MIPQAMMDFFRDFLVNSLIALNGVLPVGELVAAGAGLGGAATASGHLLSLVFGGLWGLCVSTFFGYLLVHALTALIAIVGRRFT